MMRNTIFTLLIFLSAVVIILGLLHYFKILALIALLIGFGVLIGVIIFIVLTVIVLIVAVPYYLLAKEPKIDEYGTYTLEEVKGKGEEVKKKD